ncbi:MAG: hypothetical protein J7M26_06485, partial [Armatimonadetes bacterium]|nr:hypothetical protein [Armatimonadota bacterium]
MWQEPLPEGVQVTGDVRLCLKADLHPDGTFGDEWLVITDSRLLVVGAQDGKLQQRWDLPLSEVAESQAENLVGGGALHVIHDGQRIELVRYTAARYARFAAAAQMLDKWLKGEEVQVPEPEQARCPRCGLPLEKGTKVCPACLPKTRTIARLIGYLRPHWPKALALSLLAVTNTALGLVAPYLRKPLMDDVLAPRGATGTVEQRMVLLGWLVLALAATNVLMAAAGALQA